MWVLSVIAFAFILSQSEGISVSDYLRVRENLIEKEKSEFFGANLKLTKDEVVANKYLMSVKLKEFDAGFKNISKFMPAKNFVDVHRNVEKSKLYKILRKMPKGSNLHTHGQSSFSLDYLFSKVSHLPNLYVCFANKTIRFRFFDKPTRDCRWKLMENLRKRDPKIDWKIRNYLTLPTQTSTPGWDQYLPWTKFGEMIEIVKGIFLYRPAFEMCYRKALQELYDDNILYAEFRDHFFPIYELDGKVYDEVTTIRILKDIVDDFVKSHPGFLGIRIIHDAKREFTLEEFKQDMIAFRKVKQAFPDFILGLDISDHEDGGPPDVHFIEELLKISKVTKFYFHAGETDWFGTFSDHDMVDAVLLNTTRIGHGIALIKHPKLLEIIRERDIPIELNAISNQVLASASDLRTHPASHYFATNMTIVLGNDDAGFWSSSGLSYDFYEIFLGIMPRDADLKVLKQLVINSINYSEMTKQEKQKAFKILDKSWLKFIKNLVQDASSSDSS